ncbi:hypothetical protein D3C85_1717120 [compost metagenome]
MPWLSGIDQMAVFLTNGSRTMYSPARHFIVAKQFENTRDHHNIRFKIQFAVSLRIKTVVIAETYSLEPFLLDDFLTHCNI